MASAQAMLAKWAFAVVGSHGKNPIADKLMHKLEAGGKKVWAVNPGHPGGNVLGSLHDIGEPVDVVDLVVNPGKGVAVVEEMAQLGVKNLWIQPGAESPEVLAAAARLRINVHQGCILREAPW